VTVIGESYGASLALRWKTMDPRVGKAVAIAPYCVLSNAVLNICHDYAGFLPQAFIRAGLEQLPILLGVPAEDLDTTTVLARHPVTALFVSGSEDSVIPSADVRKLFEEALPGRTDYSARRNPRNYYVPFQRTCPAGPRVAEHLQPGQPMIDQSSASNLFFQGGGVIPPATE
jgi:pimeloyl-ACP methyl ester carboxylesterase